jgi:hypothetical protein
MRPEGSFSGVLAHFRDPLPSSESVPASR